MEDPRWLDADETKTWLALVSLLIRLPAALDTQLQRDAGLSHFEYQVLSGLSMSPGRTLRMSTLAKFADSSLPRLSQVIARFEKRGWVCRSSDPEDGRYTLATLTDDGFDKVMAAAPGHVSEVRRLVFDSLTKAQQRQLRAIGDRVIHTVDPDGSCPAAIAEGLPGGGATLDRNVGAGDEGREARR
ncbi:MarR family transcriptional regulator [Asanoa sp. NPDC050611]|uniref:MarR family winged helix-turn-helix transcriptional regulator n=1 Tax=Asanoa sp. NPDC050611 TaxID=3157098 RepID=UPI0033C12EFF